MTELARRIAELSPEKRKLFDQLLKDKASPRAVAVPAAPASTSLTGGPRAPATGPRAEPCPTIISSRSS